MLKLKRIKPIGSQVLVTENLYGWDDVDAAGIIRHTTGDMKSYQKVIAVGDDVKFVKPGDTVEINFYKYAQLKESPNSLKAMDSNTIVELHLNEVELTDEEGFTAMGFLIDQRDIKYILEDFEEVTYNKDEEDDKLIKVKKPKKKLILPNTKFKL